MKNSQGVPILVPPQFAQFMAEFFGDKRGVLWPVGNISLQEFPLDSAQAQKELALEGDFLYVDSDSTGVMYIKINNPAMPWIPIRTNFGIAGFPIERIFVKWAAQPGLQINLLYGYGAKIIPPNQDISNIGTLGSITGAVSLAPWDGKNRIYSPGFFYGQSTGPIAGQNSFLRLYNPAASGINLLVDRMHASVNAAASIDIRTGVVIGALVGNGANKNLAGAVSVAELYSGSAAAVGGIQRDIQDAPATDDWVRTFEEPLTITPDTSITILSNTVNQAIRAGFEWREGV